MKNGLKAVATFTLFCFMTTQCVSAFPGATIEMAGGREIPFYQSMDIPEELGTVDALYEAPARANPQFILHIQNAHANYQAQMKIKQLLGYMNKKYGFKTIFVEGASEKLDADYLRLFSDQERNMKLCDELAKQGELTGAELFLMEQSPAQGAVEALGIEESSLYKANYDALKKVFGAETDVTRFFKGFDGKLDQVASRTFTPETRELIADWKRFEQGRRDFMPFVKSLAVKSRKILKVDLESLFAQVGWPQITRLLVVQMMEKDLNKTKGVEEQAALLKMLRTKGVSKELLTTLENFKEGTITVGKSATEVSPREVLERLASEAGPKGFKFSDYPAFSLYAGYVTLRSELDSKVLFEEIEYLFTQMLDTLTQEPEQKALLTLYRDGELLRKLLHLELNRAQWHQVLEAKDRIAVPSLVSRLKKCVQKADDGGRKEEGVKAGSAPSAIHPPISSAQSAVEATRDVMPPKFAKTMDGLFTAGLEFYDYAHKREAVFYKEMQTAMAERKINKAILITGGFHTDGMSDIFRENAVSYGIVTPRLSEKSDENLYQKVMLQNREYPFSVSYLEPEIKAAGSLANKLKPAAFAAILLAAGMTISGLDVRLIPNAANQGQLAAINKIRFVPVGKDAQGRPGVRIVPLTQNVPESSTVINIPGGQALRVLTGPITTAVMPNAVPVVVPVTARAEMRNEGKPEKEKALIEGMVVGATAAATAFGLITLYRKGTKYKRWMEAYIRAYRISKESPSGYQRPGFTIQDVDEAQLRLKLAELVRDQRFPVNEVEDFVARVMQEKTPLYTMLPPPTNNEMPWRNSLHGTILHWGTGERRATLLFERAFFESALPENVKLVSLHLERKISNYEKEFFFMCRDASNSPVFYKILQRSKKFLMIFKRKTAFDLPRDRIELTPSELIKNYPTVATRFGLSARSEVRQGEGERQPSGKMKILVVDDETMVATVARRILEREGFEVVVVDSGEAALEKIKDGGFNGVVTDVRMPGGMTGPDWVKAAIEAQLLGPEVRIVIMSGNVGDPEAFISAVTELRKEHRVDLLDKPFQKDALIALFRSEARAGSRFMKAVRTIALAVSLGLVALGTLACGAWKTPVSPTATTEAVERENVQRNVVREERPMDISFDHFDPALKEMFFKYVRARLSGFGIPVPLAQTYSINGTVSKIRSDMVGETQQDTIGWETIVLKIPDSGLEEGSNRLEFMARISLQAAERQPATVVTYVGAFNVTVKDGNVIAVGRAPRSEARGDALRSLAALLVLAFNLNNPVFWVTSVAVGGLVGVGCQSSVAPSSYAHVQAIAYGPTDMAGYIDAAALGQGAVEIFIERYINLVLDADMINSAALHGFAIYYTPGQQMRASPSNEFLASEYNRMASELAQIKSSWSPGKTADENAQAGNWIRPRPSRSEARVGEEQRLNEWDNYRKNYPMNGRLFPVAGVTDRNGVGVKINHSEVEMLLKEKGFTEAELHDFLGLTNSLAMIVCNNDHSGFKLNEGADEPAVFAYLDALRANAVKRFTKERPVGQTRLPVTRRGSVEIIAYISVEAAVRDLMQGVVSWNGKSLHLEGLPIGLSRDDYQKARSVAKGAATKVASFRPIIPPALLVGKPTGSRATAPFQLRSEIRGDAQATMGKFVEWVEKNELQPNTVINALNLIKGNAENPGGPVAMDANKVVEVQKQLGNRFSTDESFLNDLISLMEAHYKNPKVMGFLEWFDKAQAQNTINPETVLSVVKVIREASNPSLTGANVSAFGDLDEVYRRLKGLKEGDLIGIKLEIEMRKYQAKSARSEVRVGLDELHDFLIEQNPWLKGMLDKSVFVEELAAPYDAMSGRGMTDEAIRVRLNRALEVFRVNIKDGKDVGVVVRNAARLTLELPLLEMIMERTQEVVDELSRKNPWLGKFDKWEFLEAVLGAYSKMSVSGKNDDEIGAILDRALFSANQANIIQDVGDLVYVIQNADRSEARAAPAEVKVMDADGVEELRKQLNLALAKVTGEKPDEKPELRVEGATLVSETPEMGEVVFSNIIGISIVGNNFVVEHWDSKTEKKRTQTIPLVLKFKVTRQMSAEELAVRLSTAEALRAGEIDKNAKIAELMSPRMKAWLEELRIGDIGLEYADRRADPADRVAFLVHGILELEKMDATQGAEALNKLSAILGGEVMAQIDDVMKLDRERVQLVLSVTTETLGSWLESLIGVAVVNSQDEYRLVLPADATDADLESGNKLIETMTAPIDHKVAGLDLAHRIQVVWENKLNLKPGENVPRVYSVPENGVEAVERKLMNGQFVVGQRFDLRVEANIWLVAAGLATFGHRVSSFAQGKAINKLSANALTEDEWQKLKKDLPIEKEPGKNPLITDQSIKSVGQRLLEAVQAVQKILSAA